MKNIEINTKAVKKLFAAGLLAFTMAGCAGNNEPTKEETSQGEKTEEVAETKENVNVEEVLKDTDYDNGDFASEEKEYNSIGFKSLGDDETKDLREGDVITKIPDRSILEENGLDFVFVYDVYKKNANETTYSNKPLSDPSYRYDFEFEQKEIDIYDMNGKLESTSMLKNSKKITIVKAEYQYIDDLGKWGKALSLNNEALYINGKIYNVENFAKEMMGHQKTK